MKREPVIVESVCQNPKCGKKFSYSSFGGPVRKFCCHECSREYFNSTSSERNKKLIKTQQKVVKRLAKKIFEQRKKFSEKDSVLNKEISNLENELSRTDFVRSKIELMKDNNMRMTSSVIYDDLYAKYLEEKKKLHSMQAVEQKKKQRVATHNKERNALKHRLQRARKNGLRIEYKKCKGCGSVFGYIAEVKTKDGVKPIDSGNIPSFCTESCKHWYNWNTFGKKKYEEEKAKKLERQKSGTYEECESREMLITRWRGSGNFYSSQYVYGEERHPTYRAIDNLIASSIGGEEM